MKDTQEAGIKSVTQMPYFEGDFWPNVLEDCVKDVDDDDIGDKRSREMLAAYNEDDMINDDMPPSKSKGADVSNS